MNQAGINQGMSGNASVRTDRGCLVTPSGVPYDEMTPSMMLHIDLDGQVLERSSSAPAELVPTSEWRMHADIYRHFDAGAVLHAHPPHATALACQRRPIPAFHYMVAMAGGSDIRCAPYATFGTAELSRHMCRALAGRRACLLANHGMIATGADLARAYSLAVEVEALARQYLLALSAGEPVLLDEAQMAEVIERFASYGRR